VKPPLLLVSTRGAADAGAPQAMSMTCVLENPSQLIGPPGGGVVPPPPVPACETVTDLEPPSPLTVYVKETDVLSEFAPMVSVQLLEPFCATAFPPASDVLAPQLVETVTVPPLTGNTDGLAEIEHVPPPPVVPDCVQLTLMFPLPSDVAVKEAAVQERLAPIVGTGTANPAEATAAASTRLMERFVYMVYLENRWRHATIAQSKPWAIYGKDVLALTISLYGAATRAGTADKRFISSC